MFKCPVDQKEVHTAKEEYKCFIVEGRKCRSVQLIDCAPDDRPVLVHETCAAKFQEQVASGTFSAST